jgi:hypothetical protein
MSIRRHVEIEDGCVLIVILPGSTSTWTTFSGVGRVNFLTKHQLQFTFLRAAIERGQRDGTRAFGQIAQDLMGSFP